MADPAEDFDPTPYFRAPKLDVPAAIGLGCALITAVPKGLGSAVNKAAARLRETIVALQRVWAANSLLVKNADPRPADQDIDGAWGRLYRRIEDYAGLPRDRYPRATRAQELLQTLFDKGLSFTQLPYAAEWSESGKRIDLIDKEKLAADVDAVAGPEFLADVRITHKRYGEVLGITRTATPAQDPTPLVAPLRAVTRAIPAYAIQIIATIDGDRPETLATARAALLPLDSHRAAAARRAQGAKEPPATPPAATPTTPIPNLPK